MTFTSPPTAGNLLVAGLTFSGDPGDITAPSGWAQRGSIQSDLGITPVYMATFECVDCVTTSSYTWTWANAVLSAAVAVELSGRDQNSPYETDQISSGASTSPTSGSVITGTANDDIVCFFGQATVSLSQIAFSAPTNSFGDLTQIACGSPGTTIAQGYSDRANVAASTYFTAVTSNHGDDWLTRIIAYKPLPAQVAIPPRPYFMYREIHPAQIYE